MARVNICDFNLFDDHDDPLSAFELFDTTYQAKFLERNALDWGTDFTLYASSEEIQSGATIHKLSTRAGQPPDQHHLR
jgi:hypothetical protein